MGIVSAKGIRKNVPVLQVGGHDPTPPTPPVFRVVLLHTEGAGKDTCPKSVLKNPLANYLLVFNATFSQS